MEVVVLGGAIQEIRPLSGPPESWILSPAFVNAHSHLEYRGLLGKVHGADFPSWIRAITIAKTEQSLDQVREDCMSAAQENHATGVALIGEHSDRPYAREAIDSVGIGGIIFQELITFNEKGGSRERWEEVRNKARAQNATVSPHAPYTVDAISLRELGESKELLSIHVSESTAEHELFLTGTGAFADMYARLEVDLPRIGSSPIAFLKELGFFDGPRQLVHCCIVSADDLNVIKESGAVVAHCPRSNRALGCPVAPVKEMLDHGIAVGLGLDSCASSGEICMFAEMRAVLELAQTIDRPLSASEVWRMATTMGARTLGTADWDIQIGSTTPLIAIDVADASTLEEVIKKGSPRDVRWIESKD